MRARLAFISLPLVRLERKPHSTNHFLMRRDRGPWRLELQRTGIGAQRFASQERLLWRLGSAVAQNPYSKGTHIGIYKHQFTFCFAHLKTVAQLVAQLVAQFVQVVKTPKTHTYLPGSGPYRATPDLQQCACTCKSCLFSKTTRLIGSLWKACAQHRTNTDTRAWARMTMTVRRKFQKKNLPKIIVHALFAENASSQMCTCFFLTSVRKMTSTRLCWKLGWKWKTVCVGNRTRRGHFASAGITDVRSINGGGGRCWRKCYECKLCGEYLWSEGHTGTSVTRQWCTFLHTITRPASVQVPFHLNNNNGAVEEAYSIEVPAVDLRSGLLDAWTTGLGSEKKTTTTQEW